VEEATLSEMGVVREHENEIVKGHDPVDAEPEDEDDKASDETTTQTTAQAARTDNTGTNGLSLPSPTSSPTATNTIGSGGKPPLPITPTSASSQCSPSLNETPFAFQQAGAPGYPFPEESHISGADVQVPTSFDPYSCDFSSMTNNWSATPSQSATPSLNHSTVSTGFWFGNGDYTGNPSGITFSQGVCKFYMVIQRYIYLPIITDTGNLPQGGLLSALYEPLDPSLVPSNNYTLPGQSHNDLSFFRFETHSLGPPIIQQEGNMISQEVLTQDTTVQEAEKGSEEGHVARGEKRKGDKPIDKPAKKTKGTENANMSEEPSENTAGKEVEEGTAGSGEGKERSGKATLSGRIPLMPTHLAEAGYQGQKKGVRPRKVEPTKKPRSKGSSAKRASKGAGKKPPSKKNK
jgi:hypothetical protein